LKINAPNSPTRCPIPHKRIQSDLNSQANRRNKEPLFQSKLRRTRTTQSSNNGTRGAGIKIGDPDRTVEILHRVNVRARNAVNKIPLSATLQKSVL